MARLFAALAPDLSAREHLDDALTPVRSGSSEPGGLRWVRPDLWHVTVVFLGEVDAGGQDDVREACEVAASQSSAVAWRLGPAELLPGTSRPRVLVLPVVHDEALERLHRGVRRGVRSAGVSLERRRYRPHLTLARMRTPAAIRQGRAALERLAGYEGPMVLSPTLQLMLSRPGPRPVYETIGEWPLGQDVADWPGGQSDG